MNKYILLLLLLCVGCNKSPRPPYSYEDVEVGVLEFERRQSRKRGRCAYYVWDKNDIVHCGCYDDRCIESETCIDTIDPIEKQKTMQIVKPDKCPRGVYWVGRDNTLHCGCYDDRCVVREKDKDKNTRKIK